MSYRDYIHCSTCDCKLIYDGSDTVRDNFVDQYGEDYKILCPDCLKKLLTQLSPDPLALLKRCREILQEVSAQKTMVRSIEQYEDYTGGEPSLGTCKTLGKLKTIADNATTLLSDLDKAGVK